jgi:hypothetical protein
VAGFCECGFLRGEFEQIVVMLQNTPSTGCQCLFYTRCNFVVVVFNKKTVRCDQTKTYADFQPKGAEMWYSSKA